MSTDVALTRSDTRPPMHSVWSCSCSESIRDIVISPQGVIAAIAGTNIHLYAGAPSFGASHTITCPALTAYHFSADGAHFITGDAMGFVKWWEVHCGEEDASTQFPFNAPTQGNEDVQAISAVVCCTDTDLVAVSAGNNLCIYGQGGFRLHSIGPLDSSIRSIQWKKHNELAVNIGTAICMIEVTPELFTLRQKYENEIKEDVLQTLACAPNGNMMAAGCTTGPVQIWDLASESNEEISVFMKGLPGASHTDGSVRCLDWDASSRFLAAAGGSDVIVWDMMDTAEKEEGKNSSIVCYGHDKSAVITALSFQRKGTLLATGGDDGQVLVFDSDCFVSKGVLGGLVSSLIGGKLGHTDAASSITAIAWHPSGFIVAGSSDGNVEAFEIAGAMLETPKAMNGVPERPFLIKRVDNRLSNKMSGWGGEPLMPPRNGEQDKAFGRRPMRPIAGSGGGNRSPGRTPKVYLGNFKQVPRPSYPENATTTAGNWQPSMMRPTMIAPWSTYPQQQIPPYGARPTVMPAPPSDPPNNPPHTPESMNSEGAARSQHPSGPMPHRNERIINRSGSSEHTPPMIPGPPPPQYHMGYMPYPTPYPMAYPQTAYYGYHMPPHMPAEGMGPQAPGYGMPHGYPHPPINQPPKAPGLHHAASAKSESTAKIVSPEPEEDLGSKSSEATNNGVNNSVTPTQQSEAFGMYPENRQQPGLTLYVGNLAPAVEETLLMQLFAPFGPISNIQIIRERESQLSRGFGFVTYAHPMFAHAAMQQMDSIQFLGPFEGRKLKVSFSNRR